MTIKIIAVSTTTTEILKAKTTMKVVATMITAETAQANSSRNKYFQEIISQAVYQCNLQNGDGNKMNNNNIKINNNSFRSINFIICKIYT
jgi:ribosomal protein L17